LEPAGLAAHFHDAQAGRILNINWHRRQSAHRFHHVLQIGLVQVAGAQPMRIDPRIHRQQALHQLVAAHFQAENANIALVARGDIVAQAQRETGFSN